MPQSISIHRCLAVEVNKRKPGYANFSVEQPPLKLVLFEAADVTDRLNHLGVEVFADTDVAAAAERIEASGLAISEPREQTCCYATQTKASTYDPDGTFWEWYRVVDDADAFFGTEPAESRCCPSTDVQTCC